LGARSKIIHHCVPLPGPLTLLKVDTTSAFEHLTAKPKEIECCDEYQSSVLRGKSHRRAKVNYSPNGTAVVSASIANNVATLCASLQVSTRYHDRDHRDHERYYHEGQSDRNNYRSDHPWIDVHV